LTRLLPWLGPEGKPCYLDSDPDERSFLWQLADNLESVQLGMAEELLGDVRQSLSDGASDVELRSMTRSLCAALTDVLRVAHSRGDRLPASGEDELSAQARAVVDREIARREGTAPQA
jgi:hypothetical protein